MGKESLKNKIYFPLLLYCAYIIIYFILMICCSRYHQLNNQTEDPGNGCTKYYHFFILQFEITVVKKMKVDI